MKIKVLMSILLGGLMSLHANNVTLSNPTVAGQNLSFKISWDNSWNTNYEPNNNDAVWVFVKYQDCATQLWSHALLSTISGDHTAASPLQVDAVTDGKGVFIRRSAFGGGNVSPTNITLKLNIPAGTYNYKIYGVEMVNVPTGTYTVGGTGTEATKFNTVAITASTQSSGLSAATIGGSSQPIPSTFPMGYNNFYCMKYEITQQQYVDFLNSLTYTQQQARVDIAPNSAAGTPALNSNGTSASKNRNHIMIATAGNNSALPAVFACGATTVTGYSNGDDAENVPCNKLSTLDVLAYLDWAALRPMTEMEFEKVCRGPMAPVANEYAWGSTDINQAYYYVSNGSVANKDMPNETYTTVYNGPCNGSVNSSDVNYGPLRAGIFATNSSGRVSSGAAYYGAMEMSGNVWETCISTRVAEGIAFNGSLGDGELSTTGDANANTWPVGTNGRALRGCSWVSADFTQYRTADRTQSSYTTTTRVYTIGGRGVR